MRFRSVLILFLFLGGLPFVATPGSAYVVQVTVTTTPGPTATRTATPSPAPPTPYLGILTRPTDKGIEVIEILSGSPAAQAGFKVGDVLLSINGAPVLPTALTPQLARFRPGDSASFSVQRDGASLTLTVTFGERPTATPLPPTPLPGGAFVGFGLVDSGNGIKIEKIASGSPAEGVGLRPNDIIAAIDDLPVTSVGQVQAYLSGRAPGQIIRISAVRDGQTLNFTLTLGAVGPAGTTPSAASTALPTGASSTGTASATAAPQNDDSALFPPGTVRVRLGVTYEAVTDSVAKARSLTVSSGAYVLAVETGSPADLAGIKAGDVITAVEGDKVDAKRTLSLRMLPYIAGDTVTLTIVRAGQELQLSVTLALRGVA